MGQRSIEPVFAPASILQPNFKSPSLQTTLLSATI